MAHIFYFSWVREKIGVPDERLTLPPEVNTVAGFIAFLQSKGEPYASVVSHPHLRVAVNQTYARQQDTLSDGDEIALFPPVSGG